MTAAVLSGTIAPNVARHDKEAAVNATAARLGLESWLDSYEESQRELIDADPEFARWLKEEYVPPGGGWMY